MGEYCQCASVLIMTLTCAAVCAAQMVFAVMMVIKGMSYALNNPTKEILYQVRPPHLYAMW